MKIAIVGTHSTGKTTLIKKMDENFRKQGFKTVLLPELSRLSPYPVNERTNYQAQAWIQCKHIEEEAKINHVNKVLICDRSTLDNFAYFLRAIKNIDISQWERLAVQHMYSYDLIFKTRKLDIAPQEDGFRSVHEDFRTEIDSLIKKLFKKHGIKAYKLPKTTDYNTHINFIQKKIEPLMSCPMADKSLYKILKKLQ